DASIDPGTPDQVVGDRERIKQILGNLVSNAVKYTERGSVSVDVAGERSSPWQLVLTVRDTGIGIAVEDQPRLFRLFEQLDSSYAKRHFGTGLGLALTKRLVESAGGSIHVESSPGVGTSFTVRVPLILPLELPTDSSTVSKQGATPTAKAAATRGVQTKRPPRVLVAEDEPINATILQRSLESIDVVVCQAENGREAIGRLSEFEPDIIIMDAQMPEMSGVEATWHIRSLPPPLGTIPIIGLTAYSHDHDVQNLLDAGMNECHTKPLDLKVLEKTLHRHLPGLFQEQVS
ncbi:MAG: ATP-binding protein, partial [Spirochaetota bacterium]